MTDHKNTPDFLKEMGDVKPIEQDKVLVPTPGKPEIDPSYRRKVAVSYGRKDENFLTDGEVEGVAPLEVLSFKLSGIQPGVFKKLRQGKYPIDFHLDLHRKTVAEARQEVYLLFKAAIKFDYRVLLITHGKGLLSNPPARLKSYINHWLKQIDNVLAFHSAIEKQGGTGSVYVLLRKNDESVDSVNPSKYC